MKLHLILAAVSAAALTACGGGGGGGGGTDVAQQPAPAPTELSIMPMSAVTSTSVQTTVASLGGFSTLGQSPSAIRSRYSFDLLTTPVQQGSGQIIVIIGAYDNPNAGADLAKFSAQYGLPACPTVTTTYATNANWYTDAVVPRPAVGDGCTFQRFVANPNGLAAVPSGAQYDTSGMWVSETTMDIEWAHATAPMAKIVLVEAANPFISSLAGAVHYANNFADVISMSWGAQERYLTAACTATQLATDPGCIKLTQTSLYGPSNPVVNGVINYTAGGWDTQMFNNPNVTYIAASGDSGNLPLWPSVSNKVLAVGGTTDSGSTDSGWKFSGGGASLFYATPTWQSVSHNSQRTTPDVSMAADSATPMAVYITPQTGMPDTACVSHKGASSCGWYAAYGTSVSAPMWAGLASSTRAVRLANGKPRADFISSLYNVASVQGNYVMAFTDVVTGNNGTAAKVGYDTVTGLGVPKASVLINFLSN